MHFNLDDSSSKNSSPERNGISSAATPVASPNSVALPMPSLLQQHVQVHGVDPVAVTITSTSVVGVEAPSVAAVEGAVADMVLTESAEFEV